MKRNKKAIIGTLLGVGVAGALAGCIGYVDGPRGQTVYAEPGPVYVQAGIADDYVYYPDYQVYYSSTRHQYTYREGSSWVTRSAPPRVAVSVLAASPSVRLDFHDSPAAHHAAVVRQYPKHWAPPGPERRR